MKLELGNYTTEVNSQEELKKVIEQYACNNNLGKQEYVTCAKLDGKQLVIIGTNMTDDFMIEPIIFSAIKQLAKTLETKYLSDADIDKNGCETGALPKLKEALIQSIEDIYDIKIVYVWDEY